MADTKVVLLPGDEAPKDMMECAPRMKRGQAYYIQNGGDKTAYYFIKGPNKVHGKLQPPTRKLGGHVLRPGESVVLMIPEGGGESIWMWGLDTKIFFIEREYVPGA